MNRLTGFLLCGLLTAFSCKKSNVSVPNLIGTWNWNATYNDGAPGPKNPLTPVNSGIMQKLIFTKTNWNLTQNGTTVAQGSYSISITESNTGKSINQIKYTSANQADSITYYTISNDSLTFSYDLSGTVGSGSTIYTKQ